MSPAHPTAAECVYKYWWGCPVTASMCMGSGAEFDCKTPLRSISTEIDR